MEEILDLQEKLEQQEEFQDPEVLYDELTEKIRKYRPNDDLSLVRRAYLTAKNAHMDQRRKSGELYVIHPLCVAMILADLEMDLETIIAGLLHDTEEDTILVDNQIRRVFGENVGNLVDGVTKLTKINWNADKNEMQAENLRKMFLAMAKDIRVVIVKLADRLHNMRTLQHMRSEKQKEKAEETMEIYAPIAQRLGISKIKIELDDLSLKYMEPEAYEDLKHKVALRKDLREAYIAELIKDLKFYMDKAEIECTVNGRIKHFFSIYKKMVNQNKTIDQIYDLFAVRILVDNVKDCYAALGIIHENYKPIPGRFKDYIAMPKENMYQSLHTTVLDKNGQPFEIQIRTYEMHRTAEYGIAAHWKYKQAGGSVVAEQSENEEKMNWLKQILEWQTDSSDNKEFLNLIKSDLNLFAESVYCFTPNGEVKTLPAGSTPIDFAYLVHSAVGNKMVGARVNGQLVHIDYKIQNGDQIEIITSQNSKGPSRDWLNIVKSTQARNKINQWFRSENKEENIARGRELIEKYCKTKGIRLEEINKSEIQEKVMSRYAFKEWDNVLATIGHGGFKEGQIVNRMVDELEKIKKKNVTDEEIQNIIDNNESGKNPTRVKISKTESGIVVKGIKDVAVRFSRCCSPVPGDEIVGFITRGRGVSIHRTDCVNVMNLPEIERARLIPAEWQTPEGGKQGKYKTEISVYAYNRVGLIVDVSRVFTENGINIISLSSHVSKNDIATLTMGFEISGTEELRTITEKIRQISGVKDIERSTGA